MRKIRNQLFVLLPLLFLFLFHSCSIQTKNRPKEIGMFMHNARHTGVYESLSVTEKPKVLWKVKTNGQVISSPVIVEQTVYVGSGDNKMYAINAVSGKTRWEYETGGAVYSTPLVANGKVLFLSYDGYFYALNQADGKLVWKFKTGGEEIFRVKDYYNGTFQPDFWDFFLSSAVVKNNRVYFGSSDANIYALDIETGKKVWSFATEGSVHSSPAIWKNNLVAGSWDSKVYCLDTETGKKNWSYTTGRDTANYIWLGVQASPSVENGIVYIGSRDALFYAFNIETGDTLWTQNDFNRSWMPSSAAIDKENIYTGSSDAFSFYSIDKKTGAINYSTSTNAYTFSSPAIDNTMAYIGSANGRLYGINLQTGVVKWEFQTTGCQTDTLGFFNNEGKIDRERGKELTKSIQDMPALSAVYTNIFEQIGSVLSSPAIVDQVIYFGSCDGYIYAVTDK